MGGRGPQPKDPSKRVRRNKESQPSTILRFEEAEQPELPNSIPWPDETIRWWQMWGDSPQAEHFGSTDWAFLLDTAVLHANLWGNGDTSVMAELRLRVAKFGATPEDRARLRMQFAEADEKDNKRPQTSGGARERRAQIKVLHPEKANHAVETA